MLKTAAFLPFVLLVQITCGLQRTPHVIVIGAGPAGIAATTKLLENNINVTLLEAEDRIGGRINSVSFGDAVVDLGAEWCHGNEDNVVYELVKDLGVLAHSDYHFKLFASDREEIEDKLSYDLHELFDYIYKPDGNKKQMEGVSVGEYFIKLYNTTIRNRYKDDETKLDLALYTLECFHHYVLASEGAFSWFDTSATSDYRDCGGDLNLNWNGKGFKTVLKVLMKKYPVVDPNFPIDDKILLNKEVKKIVWNGQNNNAVDVTCSDGTSYIADHVIFTSSLGVLKSKHKTLFSPALPDNKITAIRDLGIGAVMKVMMHFPERWWPANKFSGFSFVWVPDQKEMLVVEFPHGPSRHGRSWLLELFGAYPVPNNPNVLSLWFTGELIPEIEKMPEQTLIDGAMFVFDKFVGHKYNISKPDKMMRTQWYSNPHFRGTYSYQTLESRKVPSSNLVLAEPLYNSAGEPALLFAGEVTHPRYYSTVHGAIETGHREANRILKHLNKAKSDS